MSRLPKPLTFQEVAWDLGIPVQPLRQVIDAIEKRD